MKRNRPLPTAAVLTCGSLAVASTTMVCAANCEAGRNTTNARLMEKFEALSKKIDAVTKKHTAALKRNCDMEIQQTNEKFDFAIATLKHPTDDAKLVINQLRKQEIRSVKSLHQLRKLEFEDEMMMFSKQLERIQANYSNAPSNQVFEAFLVQEIAQFEARVEHFHIRNVLVLDFHDDINLQQSIKQARERNNEDTIVTFMSTEAGA